MFGHGSELGFTIRALSPSDYSLSRNGDLEWARSSPRFHRGGDCGDTIGSVGPSMEGGGGELFESTSAAILALMIDLRSPDAAEA